MSRVACLSLAAVLTVFATLPVLAESATIRIEPRPYHGAIVTLERGVRVWRPLPPNRYVIINPDGATPLSLGLTDIRKRSTSRNFFYGDSSPYLGGAAAARNTYGVPRGYGYGYGYGRKHGRPKHHGRHGYVPRQGGGMRSKPGRGGRGGHRR